MTTRASHPTGLLFLALGFVLWSSALVVLYAVLSVGCELGWDRVIVGPASALRVVLLVVWAGHIAALAWLCWRCRRLLADGWFGTGTTGRFLGRAALGATAAALVATVWTGIAVPGVTLCF